MNGKCNGEKCLFEYAQIQNTLNHCIRMQMERLTLKVHPLNAYLGDAAD